MPVSLTLLDGVRWQGAPVVGERSQALLAALASAGGRAVRAERLVELVWGDESPANAAKGLQVVVSRTRTALGADAIVRDGDGYRLGIAPEQVDSCRLTRLVGEAGRVLATDPLTAAGLAREALALVVALPAGEDDVEGALAEVRRRAARDAHAARLLLARAAARTGQHEEALPVLEAAHAEEPDDESLLAELLRSEAAVRGTGAALGRFEDHRRALRDRLGANPGDELRRVHRDLLALDQPVRSGVRFDATALLGRDADVARLRALLSGARVVSIVGPGGLGKTRLAHVLARDAGQPVVHVVELVGVTAPENLVGEVGSALGVRDSVAGRRTLTPEQRADVRGRIAQQLAGAPSLLILDNCEHIVAAVADLVAFLVAVTPDLRVLTTSRAPLAIGAERVYQLDALAPADAAELFRRRAVAARPGVQLDPGLVARIVERLDGLPLAIELAAARTRAMSVEEIDRRLEDRFALLRGGDRSAPDRHQTLLAVIDWSWNLLDDAERRALRRLALFHDGFTFEAAAAVLGGDPLETVQSLADQSLLSVREAGGGVRFRMLETVREFGRLQLTAAGEDAEARAAQWAWAARYAWEHGRCTFSIEQLAAIDALAAEEANLADVLREALAASAADTVIELLAGLSVLWSIRGEHLRVLVLTEAVVEALAGWSPPPALADAARVALATALRNAMVVLDERTAPLWMLLEQLGPGSDGDPRIAALTRTTLTFDPADPSALIERLTALAAGSDRLTTLMAEQWLAFVWENTGDQDRALRAAERALSLTRTADGPWAAASLHTQLAQLTAQVGRHDLVAGHASAALPVLERLGANDDVVQLHALLALCALAAGRLDDATAEIDLIEEIEDAETMFGGVITVQVSRAELALARGDHRAGLLAYRLAVERMRALVFPGMTLSGQEPWVLLGESTALTAFAHYGTPEDEDDAWELVAACRRNGALVLEGVGHQLDYPIVGGVLFALGSWSVLRAVGELEQAIRLLALAERFAYNRTVPTMAWERIVPHVEALAPGRLAARLAELGERRGPKLVEEAKALLDQLVVR